LIGGVLILETLAVEMFVPVVEDVSVVFWIDVKGDGLRI
jgi:hypothetical protein